MGIWGCFLANASVFCCGICILYKLRDSQGKDCVCLSTPNYGIIWGAKIKKALEGA